MTASRPADAPRDPRAVAVFEALASLGQAIAGARTAEAIGAQCADALAALTGASWVSFGIREPDGSVPRLVARGDQLERDRQALLELAARAGPLEVRADVAARLAAHGVTLAEPVGAWAGVPISAGETVLGALSLATREPHELDAAALAVARAIAGQAGVALQNTRLLLALSEGKREWEETVDAISDGICVLDGRGTIRRANRAFCALADVPVTAVAGRPWITLVPPTWADAFQRIMDTPGAAPAELRAGERLFHVSALHLADAGMASVVLVVSDQTEKRRLQEQLLQSEKMSAIGQLIAGVAHDLNNPLASVVGFADYLAEASDTTPTEMLEPLRAIQQEAERAANIVKNLLDFARKQEGRRVVRPIEDILSATLLLLRNQLMAAKIDTEVDVAPGAPPVLVDPNQIQQVFVNLIANAAQAIHSSGVGSRIVIRAVSWLDGIAITVEDDGPGVPPEDAQRVFEPFFTTKPAGEGTGLGLSICQGIVKEHGGRLTLVPTQRRGAVFQVELPAGGTAPSPSAPAPATAPFRRLRILVVDDEPHIQHYMKATLEAWGHTVTVAANGRTGLDHAVREPFDVIIADLRMPEMGGREMFERLTVERPDAAARVVFSTGDTVRGDTLTFLESLQRPHLRKPFTLVELRAALADAGRRTA